MRIDRAIEGLKIFKANGGTDIWAEHDELHSGPENPLAPEVVAELDKLGWYVWEDDETNYVFYC